MFSLEENRELLLSLFDYKDGKLYWKDRPCKNISAGSEAGLGKTDAYGYLRVGYKK